MIDLSGFPLYIQAIKTAKISQNYQLTKKKPAMHVIISSYQTCQDDLSANKEFYFLILKNIYEKIIVFQ